jgi:hypothetical protein
LVWLFKRGSTRVEIMKKVKREIEGITYEVSELDALSALKIQAKLIKILGPAIADLKGSKLTKEVAKERMTAAILSLVERFDDEAVVDLMSSLFEEKVNYEHTDGNLVKATLSTHFTGKLSAMWKVALFILEVNFGDLLGKFKSSSVIKESLEELKNDT